MMYQLFAWFSRYFPTLAYDKRRATANTLKTKKK